MGDPERNTPKMRRARDPMPKAVELRLLQAIARNVRELGRPAYEVLAVDPEFIRWIGRDLGGTGEKRFKRLSKNVARGGAGGPASEVNEDHRRWAEREVDARFPSSRPSALTKTVMRKGTPFLLDIERGAHLLEEAALNVERVTLAATEEDPTAPGGRRAILPDILLKASKTGIDVFNAQMRLAEVALSALGSTAAVCELVELAKELIAPEHRAEFVRRAQEIARKHAGMAS